MRAEVESSEHEQFKEAVTMSTKIKITDTQGAVLNLAVKTRGRIEQFPDNVNGGARSKVLRALVAAGLVKNEGEGCWLTDAGYAAIGQERSRAEPAAEIAVAPVKAERRTRENSKQAQVITMLRRPEGATIAQICEVTNWRQHTVRGTFAGAFKKRLGLTITSEKAEGGARVYRITEDI